MGLQLWEGLFLSRLLPSVTSTLSALVLVLLLIRVFRVRNPHTRYLLFHLPLIKGLLVLIRGLPPPPASYAGRVGWGLQLVDPFSLIPAPSYRMFLDLSVQPTDFQPLWNTRFAELAMAAAAGAAIGILAYRWAGLVAFYRRLLSRPAATRESSPRLFGLLDRLVPASGVAYPRVVLIEEEALVPFTVGVRPATIAFSPQLLSELDDEKLEAVLAHELAHIARWDGVLHWPSLLLRDLLAFNPVAQGVFGRLLVEREKDADLRAAEVIGHPQAMAKALVEVCLLAKGANLRPVPGSVALRHHLVGRTAVVEERVRALLQGPVGVSRLRTFGLGALLVFFILVRIFVYFPVAGHIIVFE